MTLTGLTLRQAVGRSPIQGVAAQWLPSPPLFPHGIGPKNRQHQIQKTLDKHCCALTARWAKPRSRRSRAVATPSCPSSRMARKIFSMKSTRRSIDTVVLLWVGRSPVQGVAAQWLPPPALPPAWDWPKKSAASNPSPPPNLENSGDLLGLVTAWEIPCSCGRVDGGVGLKTASATPLAQPSCRRSLVAESTGG